MNLRKLIFTNNACYKAGRTITVKGIMVHSTGANNPNLRRYVGPDDGLLGKNQYNNHWNQDKPDGRQVCVHGFIGKLADGSIATYQTLPWNHRGWHGASGSKGSVNDSHTSFEICEDGLTDKAYFNAIYKEATELCAYLCKEYNLDPMADGVIITILASYAQEESRSVSENQKWRIRKDFKEGKPSNNIRIYGFDYKDFKLTIIPEEAEVVRMIFADYLSGLGKNAIMKKLIRLGVPTKCGGRWSESTIGSILGNEKFIGDTCLQKGFITDHLTKQWKSNSGELPKYYVEGSHEAIIDRETFEAVQIEMARRAAKANHPRKLTFSEFSGLITCKKCGAKFRKKVSGVGTKYAKVVWACATYTYRGKHECAAKRIPEDILKEKCTEVLGLAEYDPNVLAEKITAIAVPDDGVLVFTFKDGTEQTATWENRSRRESWTDEMRQTARERALGGTDNG